MVKPLPRLSAGSYVLADLDTGEVLAARNPHRRLRPASTLKVLTALTLLPELDPDDVYTAVWEDANVEGSKVGVVPDATYTVHNLFEGLFLMSGNDAANALANAGGGVPETVAAMNATARELGARDTTAVNPSGLDAPHQLTTSYDLALIARAALQRPDFQSYATTVKSKFPGKMPKKHKKRRAFEIYTQNKLVLNYRGAIGVKTGWTTKAKGTFVGAAERGDRRLIAVVLRTKGPGWEESAKLLDWGFAHADAVTAVGSLNPPANRRRGARVPAAACRRGGSGHRRGRRQHRGAAVVLVGRPGSRRRAGPAAGTGAGAAPAPGAGAGALAPSPSRWTGRTRHSTAARAHQPGRHPRPCRRANGRPAPTAPLPLVGRPPGSPAGRPAPARSPRVRPGPAARWQRPARCCARRPPHRGRRAPASRAGWPSTRRRRS